MTWPPWRHRDDQSAAAEGDIAQDRAAREQAEDRLAETQKQWPEVRRVARELRRQRKANMFSERIMHAIRGDESA